MIKKIKNWKNWIENRPVPLWVWLSSLVLLSPGAGAITLVYLYIEDGIYVIGYIIPAILAVVASPFAIWRMIIMYEQKETERKRHYTDSYIHAVDNLGNDDTAIRIGGIYGLEIIMKQDEDHYLNIVRLLCDFIRKNSSINEDPEKKCKPEKTKEDIQTALKVLGRRPEKMIEKLEEKFWMNLIGAHLPSANLEGLNFRKADLQKTHLEDANLSGAHLEGADLRNAHLEESDLSGAYLEGADLRNANLERARLSGARLEGADLQRANLSCAHITDLSGAIIISSNLCAVDLSSLTQKKGLKQERINRTFGNAETKLPKIFKHPDYWLKTKLDPKREYDEWQKWLKDPKNYKPPTTNQWGL